MVGLIKCFVRTVYYWFRYPVGFYISGHDYIEQKDGSLRCKDCGHVSK